MSATRGGPAAQKGLRVPDSIKHLL